MIRFLLGIIVALTSVMTIRYYLHSDNPLVNGNGPDIPTIIYKFKSENAIKVASVNGTVQVSSTDVRWMGMLRSHYLVKSPFSVEYFVDLHKLSRRDFIWNRSSRTLQIYVPDVTVGAPNIDEAHATLTKISGMYVTRDAAMALMRSASAKASMTARLEASKPAPMAEARKSARAALQQQSEALLGAAGVDVRTVQVHFDGEPDLPIEPDPQPMDRSRSLKEIFGL